MFHYLIASANSSVFCSILVGTVEHLLKLSDEYDVKLIRDACKTFVTDQPITRENVMQLLSIADMCGLEDVRRGCNNFLKDLKLKTLSETVHLDDLDLKEVRHFLEQRIERLETFLHVLHPQFMGLLDFLSYLLCEAHRKGSSPWCEKHVNAGLMFRQDCEDCCSMLDALIKDNSYKRDTTHSPGGTFLNHSLPSVIKDFEKLTQG